MHKKAIAVIMSLVVALILLFGSWQAIQWWQVKKPIESAVNSHAGLRLDRLTVDPTVIDLELSIENPQFPFVNEYPQLLSLIEQKAGQRKLTVRLLDHRDADLQNAWNEMTFGVEEGIALCQYTKIPQTIASVAQKYGIRYQVRMDERSVYVELNKGNRFLVEVLPLKKESGVNTVG